MKSDKKEIQLLRSRLFDTVNQNLKLLSVIDSTKSMSQNLDHEKSLKLICHILQDILPEQKFSLIISLGEKWKLFTHQKNNCKRILIEKFTLNSKLVSANNNKLCYEANEKEVISLKPIIENNFPDIEKPNDYIIFPLVGTEPKAVLGFILIHRFGKPIESDNMRLLEICQRQIANQLLTSYFYLLSNLDSLTNLYNKRYVISKLEYEMKRSSRNNNALSIMMIDLDDFKNINDQFGHIEGDNVLAKIGKLLLDMIREIDIAARFGGDEFLLILPETNIDEAQLVALRFQKLLSQCGFGSPNNVAITTSIGVAQFDVTSDKISENLIDRVDKSMYSGKTTGKDKIVIANAL